MLLFNIGVNDCSFVYLTLILSLHYLAKCRSRSLAVSNNEFIMGSASVGLKIIIRLQNQLRSVACLPLIVFEISGRTKTTHQQRC